MSEHAAQKFALIKRYISENKIKITDLALEAGYARPYISSVLNGKLSYNDDLLDVLLRALNIDYDKEMEQLQTLHHYFKDVETAIQYFDFNQARRMLNQAFAAIPHSSIFHEQFARIQSLEHFIDTYEKGITVQDSWTFYDTTLRQLCDLTVSYHRHTVKSHDRIFKILLDPHTKNFAYWNVRVLHAELLMYENEYSKAMDLVDSLLNHFQHHSNVNGLFLVNMLKIRLLLRSHRISNATDILKNHHYLIHETYRHRPYFHRYAMWAQYEYRWITRNFYLTGNDEYEDTLSLYYRMIFTYYSGNRHHFEKMAQHYRYFDHQPALITDTYALIQNLYTPSLSVEDLDNCQKRLSKDYDGFVLAPLKYLLIQCYENNRSYKSANALLKDTEEFK